MTQVKKSLAFTALALSFTMSAQAADPVKIGFIGSLTGPLSTLSTDMKDGFNLALKHKGGKFGGADTVIVYGDDQANPDTGKQVYERLAKSENVDIITGMAFTNVMLAVAPAAFKDKIFFVNSNAGPKELAGASCNYYYFNPTWHTSALSEAAGRFANQKGYKRMFVVAPNYQAGREHVDGFDKEYTGEIAGRAYNKIGQLDFSVEIGQIRAANPDAVFFALWGPMAINFVKQFNQAGLNKKIDLVTAGFAVDADILPALGDAAVGIYNTSQWSPDFTNPVNKKFVEDFEKEYKRPASIYASQGYEVGLLLDAAIRDSKGKHKDNKVLHDALMAAKYDSVRGYFKFASNQNPTQHVYLRQVVKNDKGQLTNKTVSTTPVHADKSDPYVGECKIAAQ
ncbi:ABC transporter substrate-binding protein [Noviherbaspirillum denitrificans]|uniref:ABC transporter substrate-binding protein n=1 Tax=Noviherbaspirillum denitrificans TaxID=1968433 RepID=A0A254TAP7_9BURK|nr:ABC transporter substrate-binding protein [Noviherbaspirillum denitrificans]OWW19635.1 ABC transporter substrate-binding protein [Noviherbaspirillum denitrificans]